MSAPTPPEVWLRGPLAGYHPLVMPAAHSLLQSLEELERVAGELTPVQLWQRPGGAASVGFHFRHVAGSIDRLLTYAADQPLDERQRAWLAAEAEAGDPPADGAALLAPVRAQGGPRRWPSRARWGAGGCRPPCGGCSSTWPSTRSGTWGRR